MLCRELQVVLGAVVVAVVTEAIVVDPELSLNEEYNTEDFEHCKEIVKLLPQLLSLTPTDYHLATNPHNDSTLTVPSTTHHQLRGTTNTTTTDTTTTMTHLPEETPLWSYFWPLRRKKRYACCNRRRVKKRRKRNKRKKSMRKRLHSRSNLLPSASPPDTSLIQPPTMLHSPPTSASTYEYTTPTPKIMLSEVWEQLSDLLHLNILPLLDSSVANNFTKPYLERIRAVNHEMVDKLLQADVSYTEPESITHQGDEVVCHLLARRQERLNHLTMLLTLLFQALPHSLEEMQQAALIPEITDYIFRPEKKAVFDVYTCRQCYARDTAGVCREIYFCKSGQPVYSRRPGRQPIVG